MKKIRIAFAVLILLILHFGEVKGQVLRIIALEQNIEGGASGIKNIQDKGDQNENHSRFFIYAEIKKNSNVIISHLWIKRRLYECKSESAAPPIIILSEDPGLLPNDTLLRKTNGDILKLNYTGWNNSKPAVALQKVVNTNNVVVVYQLQNKTRYAVLKSFTKIHTLHTPGMQPLNNYPNKIFEKKSK